MIQIKAIDAAKYFIRTSNLAKRSLSNKKLQKLIYYAQAWSLALKGKPMFSDRIEAWIHGPVIPAVYQSYKQFGFGNIIDNSTFEESTLKEHLDILDEVWRVYGKFDADYLELLTHNEDPWILARDKIDEKRSSKAIISQDLMRKFYCGMLKKIKNDK